MSRRSHYRRSVLRRACAAAGALGLGAGLLAGTAILAATPASAIPIPPSTSSCTYNGSPVAFVASNAAGTPVTVACTGLPANTLLIVAQTSPLAGVISPSSAATSEADLSTGTAVTTSATGTLTATITVTATGGSPSFSALDKKAVCPPTQAQVNAGLTNCVVTVADNGNVYATGTPGTVDDAVVAGDRIKNAKFASADGTPSAGLAECEIARPFMDDGVAA